jgi:hypothetical protein
MNFYEKLLMEDLCMVLPRLSGDLRLVYEEDLIQPRLLRLGLIIIFGEGGSSKAYSFS